MQTTSNLVQGMYTLWYGRNIVLVHMPNYRVGIRIKCIWAMCADNHHDPREHNVYKQILITPIFTYYY